MVERPILRRNSEYRRTGRNGPGMDSPSDLYARIPIVRAGAGGSHSYVAYGRSRAGVSGNDETIVPRSAGFGAREKLSARRADDWM